MHTQQAVPTFNFAAKQGDLFRQFARHPAVIHNSCFRNQHRSNPGTMRLAFPQFFQRNPAAIHSVSQAAGQNVIQSWQFLLPGRHYHLAAKFKGNFMLCAKLDQPLLPRPAVDGPQRTGAIINSGMNDSRVMPSLMGRHAGFFFEDPQRNSRLILQQLITGCQPDNSSSHDDDVIRFHGGRFQAQSWERILKNQ